MTGLVTGLHWALWVVLQGGLWQAAPPPSSTLEAHPPGEAHAPADANDDGEEDDEAAPGPRLPMASFESTTVTRQGPLRETPHRRDVMTRADLQRRNMTNLADAMQWLAAGSSVQTAGSGLAMTIDGLDASHITVMINGMPVSRPLNSNLGPVLDPQRIPIQASRVRRLEVHRGAGPVGSLQSGGVVINLVTDDTAPASAQVGVDLAGGLTTGGEQPDGTLQRTDAGATFSVPVSDAVSLGADVLWNERRAWDGNADGTFDLPEQRSLTAGTQFGWSPSRRDQLQAEVRWQETQLETLGALRSPLFDRTRTGEWRGNVRGVHRRDNGRLTHDTSLTHLRHRFDKIVRESGFVRPRTDTEVWQVRQATTRTWHLGAHDFSVETGLDLEEVSRTGPSGGLPSTVRVMAGAGAGDRWDLGRLELDSRVFAGADEDARVLWLAGTQGLLPLGAGFSLRGGFSRTFRRASVEELFLVFDHAEVGYRVVGNEGLVPETVRSSRLGLIWNEAKDRWGAEFEAYTHRQDNLIASVADPTQQEGPIGTFTYDNIGEARTVGANASAEARALPGGLFARVSWAWLPVARDLDLGERLLFRAEHSVRGELRGSWWQDRLQAFAALSSRSPLSVPADQPAAPGFQTVDVGVTGRLPAGWDLGFTVFNLANQVNSVWGPKPGRLALATLRWQTP
jgi:outer membrane receptor protein involved in Fe transport